MTTNSTNSTNHSKLYRATWIIKRLLSNPNDLPTRLMAKKFVEDVEQEVVAGVNEATEEIRRLKRNGAKQ